jgi:hypothetical protein
MCKTNRPSPEIRPFGAKSIVFTCHFMKKHNLTCYFIQFFSIFDEFQTILDWFSTTFNQFGPVLDHFQTLDF